MDGFSMSERPRRNRRTAAMRDLVRETVLRPADLVWPVFVVEGEAQRQPIASMPGCDRYSIDVLVEEARSAYELGIPAVALFPALGADLKDRLATESQRTDGLLQRAIRRLKMAVPEVLVITDVAMDPYSSDGHDGLVEDGRVLNDETLPILAAMAVSQAEAGTDIIAPSDMMDGRIGFIRDTLDDAGHEEVGILSYAVKYASAFYGPFRSALDSAPRTGDKQTYQMDPANRREALREASLDLREGADMLLVKPALAYLDVIADVRADCDVPVAAYQVSGEYAMIHAAGAKGWLETDAAMDECLLAIKRAGADVIFTYAAREAAARLG